MYMGIMMLGRLKYTQQIKKTEMGRTCGTYGREEMCIQGFGGET
jgi:hypothetical protein